MSLIEKYLLIRWDRSLVRCKLILAVKYKMSNENISYFSSNFTIVQYCSKNVLFWFMFMQNSHIYELKILTIYYQHAHEPLTVTKMIFWLIGKFQHFTYFSCRILQNFTLNDVYIMLHSFLNIYSLSLDTIVSIYRWRIA